MKVYRLIDHTADLGVRVLGRTLAALFENAGVALFDLITDVRGVRPTLQRTFTVQARNREELLVAWLSELLYCCDVELLLFTQFSVQQLSQTEVYATARGEPLDETRHNITRMIKAVTYHNLAITATPDGWSATVIFDV